MLLSLLLLKHALLMTSCVYCRVDQSDNELTRFNIQVDVVNATTFFNMEQLPNPIIPPVIPTNGL